MLKNLEAAFYPWGLTEDQELTLIETVQAGIEQSLDHYEKGLSIDEKMSDIFKRLAQFST